MASKETLTRCHELAKVCKAAYAGPIRHSIYTYKGIPFENQKIIHGSFGRGYCRLFWNKDNTVIAFRGTRESVDWSISNLKAFPVPLRDCDNELIIHVHRGFQRTLDYGDKSTELRSLDAIVDYLQEYELLNRSVTITGHSLGGALAILFATKLRCILQNNPSFNIEEIVTFGSPAVGLKRFKGFYGALNNKTIRVVNQSDAVPFTPPLFYHHVGKEVWLKESSYSTNSSWQIRLKHAFKGCITKLKSNHDMREYISQLSLIINE